MREHKKGNSRARRRKENDNKAEISVSWLVTIILLALGFVILLFLYWQFSYQGIIDSETCHQSILLRATVPSLADRYIPLKCRTDKICITSSIFGKCDEFAGVKGVTRMRVRDKTDVEQAISRSILNCWSMAGEGRIPLISKPWMTNFGLEELESDCLICSRIAFDRESLEKSEIKLEEVDVGKYMDTHLVTGKDFTYTAYLSEGSPSKFRVETDIEKIREAGGDVGREEDFEIGSLENDRELMYKELGVLFMQVQGPPSGEDAALNSLKAMGITLGSSFAVSPRAGFTLAKFAVSKIGLVAIAAAGIYQQHEVSKNQAATASYCSDVQVGDDSRRQCSVVRTVNYNAEQISKYCSVIESIP